MSSFEFCKCISNVKQSICVHYNLSDILIIINYQEVNNIIILLKI